MQKTENEVILLINVLEHINKMINHAILTLQGNDPRCNIRFNDSNQSDLFFTYLVDFLSKTDKSAPVSRMSFLKGILEICKNPQFSIENSVDELKIAVESFTLWLEEKKLIDIWFPSVHKHITLDISRIDYIKINGNLCKHNALRAIGVLNDFKKIMEKSGVDITRDQALIAISDFHDRFKNDILIYLSSYMCEFLNNICWAIHKYLKSEFKRSYHITNQNIPLYNYKIPPQIKSEYARSCYWDLMNLIRKGPIIRKFIISDSFKSEY